MLYLTAKSAENFSKVFQVSLNDLYPVFVMWKNKHISSNQFLRCIGELSPTSKYYKETKELRRGMGPNFIVAFKATDDEKQPFEEKIIEDAKAVSAGYINELGVSVDDGSEFSIDTKLSLNSFVFGAGNGRYQKRILEQRLFDREADNTTCYLTTVVTERFQKSSLDVYRVAQSKASKNIIVRELNDTADRRFVITDSSGIILEDQYNDVYRTYDYTDGGLLLEITLNDHRKLGAPNVFSYRYDLEGDKIVGVTYYNGGIVRELKIPSDV